MLRVQNELGHQRGVARVCFQTPQRFLDFPRLFGFSDMLLTPFDLEGDVQANSEAQAVVAPPVKSAARTTSSSPAAASFPAGAQQERAATPASLTNASVVTQGEGAAVPALGFDLSSAFCLNNWLHVGGAPSLSANEALELQALVCEFVGIDALFSAAVDPATSGNATFTGARYSLAFLLEAALKDKMRQVDTPYHTPWDEEVREYFRSCAKSKKRKKGR